MKSETWVSSAALLNRMNFALALTAGRIRGLKIAADQFAGSPPLDPAMQLSALEAKLLAADVSKQTHDSIVAQLGAPAATAASDQQGKKGQPPRPPDANMIAGLLLGSPEFQRR